MGDPIGESRPPSNRLYNLTSDLGLCLRGFMLGSRVSIELPWGTRRTGAR